MKKKYITPETGTHAIKVKPFMDNLSVNVPINPTPNEVYSLGGNSGMGYGGGYTGSSGAHSRGMDWDDDE